MTFDPLGGGSRVVGRRAARRAEQKRKRRRNLRLGAGVLALALAAVTVVLVARGTSGGKHHGATRTQHTLLLQVQGASRTAVASALLAHEPKTNEGAVVLVPPQVIVSVPGAGAQPFGRSLLSSPRSSRDALADLIGVTIDGSWVLDARTFARLVDTLGGVQVTLDVPLMSGRVILVPAGPQRLSGANALAFATYLQASELEQTRLARLQAVLDGIVSALPSSAASLLGSLGRGSQLSVPVATAADLLTGLKSDDGQQQLQYRSLPVIKVDVGTDEIRFRVDPDGTRALVDELLADSVPPGIRSGGKRVLVLNGVGTPGLGQHVRTKLVAGGFVFVGSRNAPTFGYAKTIVLVKDATAAGAALGAQVARVLGVPASAVVASDQVPTFADVVVIVGRDFRS